MNSVMCSLNPLVDILYSFMAIPVIIISSVVIVLKIENMFFNFERYDLGRVGVYKFNTKFDLSSKSEVFCHREDLLHILR